MTAPARHMYLATATLHGTYFQKANGVGLSGNSAQLRSCDQQFT